MQELGSFLSASVAETADLRRRLAVSEERADQPNGTRLQGAGKLHTSKTSRRDGSSCYLGEARRFILAPSDGDRNTSRAAWKST